MQCSKSAAGLGCGLEMESVGHPRCQGLEIAGGLEELFSILLGGSLGGLPDTAQLWFTAWRLT